MVCAPVIGVAVDQRALGKEHVLHDVERGEIVADSAIIMSMARRAHDRQPVRSG